MFTIHLLELIFWNQKVVFPMYRLFTIMLIKLSNNEKLTDDEMEQIKKVIADIFSIIRPSYVF